MAPRESGSDWRDPFYAACINDIAAMLPRSRIETTNHYVKDLRSSSYGEVPFAYDGHNPGPDFGTSVPAITSSSYGEVPFVYDGHNPGLDFWTSVPAITSSSYGEVPFMYDGHNPGPHFWTSVPAVTSQNSPGSESSTFSALTDKSTSSTALDSLASSVGSETLKADQTFAEGSKLSTAIDVRTLPTATHQHGTSSVTRNDTTSTCDQSSIQPTSASPETVIAASPSSATCAVSSSSDDEKAHCDMCSKSFSGTRQHRESNLKRHMNDIHQLGMRLCCMEPGCGKMCGRADNLRSHRLKVHGIDDPRVRPPNSTRQKKIAKRRKRTPPVLGTI